MSDPADTIPDDIDALKAALLAERAARREFQARASGAEAMVAHLKLLIAKFKRDRFDTSSERSRKLLDQLEMQLEELETAAAEDEAAAGRAEPDTTTVRPFTRAKPARAPLPGHLPRERVVIPSPTNSLTPWSLARAAPNSAKPSPRRWRAFRARTRSSRPYERSSLAARARR